jgi:hypothetical protein
LTLGYKKYAIGIANMNTKDPIKLMKYNQTNSITLKYIQSIFIMKNKNKNLKGFQKHMVRAFSKFINALNKTKMLYIHYFLVGLVPLITSSFFCLKKYTIIGCNFS